MSVFSVVLAAAAVVGGAALVLFSDRLARVSGLRVMGFDSGDKAKDIRSMGWALVAVGVLIGAIEVVFS